MSKSAATSASDKRRQPWLPRDRPRTRVRVHVGCVLICGLPTGQGVAAPTISSTCVSAVNHDLTLKCRVRWTQVVVKTAAPGLGKHARGAAGSRGQPARLIQRWAVGVERVRVGSDLMGLRAVVDDLDALARRYVEFRVVHASVGNRHHRWGLVWPGAGERIEVRIAANLCKTEMAIRLRMDDQSSGGRPVGERKHVGGPRD